MKATKGIWHLSILERHDVVDGARVSEPFTLRDLFPCGLATLDFEVAALLLVYWKTNVGIVVATVEKSQFRIRSTIRQPTDVARNVDITSAFFALACKEPAHQRVYQGKPRPDPGVAPDELVDARGDLPTLLKLN